MLDTYGPRALSYTWRPFISVEQVFRILKVPHLIAMEDFGYVVLKQSNNMKAEALGRGVGYQQRRPSKPGWHGHDEILCEKKEPLERSYRIQTSSFYILGYRQAGGKYLLYIDLCFLPLVSLSFIARELKKIICNQNLGPIFKLLMTSAKKSTEVIHQIARERHVEFRARNVHLWIDRIFWRIFVGQGHQWGLKISITRTDSCRHLRSMIEQYWLSWGREQA